MVVVREVDGARLTGQGYLGFERVTQCPLSRDLIEIELLSAAEVRWVNEYHSEVLSKLSGSVTATGDEAAVAWLRRYCAVLS